MKHTWKKITAVIVASIISSCLLASAILVFPAQDAFAQLTASQSGTAGYTGSYCTGATGTIITGTSKLGDVFKFFTCLIEVSVVPLLFALAVAIFVWGMVKFIGSEATAEKEDGKQFMLWGIIAIAVMFSVWGLVNIFNKTFSVGNVIPQVPVNPVSN